MFQEYLRYLARFFVCNSACPAEIFSIGCKPDLAIDICLVVGVRVVV
jgi:hypothetical protein